MCRVKCGILPLQLEIGHYRRTPLTNRLCIICDSNVVDNEVHFIYGCSGLADVRTQFEGKVFLPLALEDRELLDTLKENFSSVRMKNFGEFVETMFERRRDLMYNSYH